jgi:hypothetical protein
MSSFQNYLFGNEASASTGREVGLSRLHMCYTVGPFKGLEDVSPCSQKPATTRPYLKTYGRLADDVAPMFLHGSLNDVIINSLYRTTANA